jgi:tetratricopeptide (TPR) repeat protein
MLIHPLVLLALAGLNIGFGIFALLQAEYGLGALLLFVGVLALFTHFNLGTVMLAFRSMGKGQYDKAERQLRQTVKPEWLSRRLRAYYYYLMGLLLQRRGAFAQAYPEYEKALRLGLRTPTETATVHLQMAETAIHLQQPDVAQQHLTEALARTDHSEVVLHAEVLRRQLDETF